MTENDPTPKRKYTRRWQVDDDGWLQTFDQEITRTRKHTQKDKRLYNHLIDTSETPAEKAERLERNGKGLERYTRYL